jgi:ATP-dependent DNA ligase
MTTNKRDFSNFEAFPGHIEEKGERYIFPSVVYKDTMSRTRNWNVYIRLLQSNNGIHPPRRKINWDIEQDKTVPIEPSYYKGKIGPDIISQIWTEQGIVDKTQNYKVTRSIPTYVSKGKNLGKKNETNVFTQSLIQARSKYLKKMQESAIHNNTMRVFPVSVHKYEDSPKDITKHIKYPVAVQRKLDGGRIVMHWDMEKSTPVMYTRKLKDISSNTHIIDEAKIMYKIINKYYTGAYLDGEIYKHGISLQQISGNMRQENKTNDLLLEYHVFDVFFPFDNNKSKLSFKERSVILKKIFKYVVESGTKLKYFINVETLIANDKHEETKLYNQFLKEKYEGSIVKNLDAVYEFGKDKEIRSYQMRKRKPRYSAEYEIIGWTEGTKGKDKNAIIWILKTKLDRDKNLQPVVFTATPVNMNYKERYDIFNRMTHKIFDTEYKGKMMTVEYDDISNDGVPLRAKAKNIRLLV